MMMECPREEGVKISVGPFTTLRFRIRGLFLLGLLLFLGLGITLAVDALVSKSQGSAQAREQIFLGRFLGRRCCVWIRIRNYEDG